MSKRKLLQLVEDGTVEGWDDPRMPTITGLRRRGYTPESIRLFAERIGVARSESMVEMAQLEDCIREDLNARAQRAMVVLRPVKLVIENYPDGHEEAMEAVNNPEDASMGTRKVPFSKVLYIEQDDFKEDPPKKYWRLFPGNEVRLRYAYIIKCTGVVKDEKTGEILEIHCTYDPETRSGTGTAQRKVKSTIHWVSARHAHDVTVRLYDRLLNAESPAGEDWQAQLNPSSLEILSGCKAESFLGSAKPDDRYQFERLGYFCVDTASREEHLLFNRTVTLRDTWAKISKR